MLSNCFQRAIRGPPRYQGFVALTVQICLPSREEVQECLPSGLGNDRRSLNPPVSVLALGMRDGDAPVLRVHAIKFLCSRFRWSKPTMGQDIDDEPGNFALPSFDALRRPT